MVTSTPLPNPPPPPPTTTATTTTTPTPHRHPHPHPHTSKHTHKKNKSPCWLIWTGHGWLFLKLLFSSYIFISVFVIFWWVYCIDFFSFARHRIFVYHFYLVFEYSKQFFNLSHMSYVPYDVSLPGFWGNEMYVYLFVCYKGEAVAGHPFTSVLTPTGCILYKTYGNVFWSRWSSHPRTRIWIKHVVFQHNHLP